MQDINNLDKQLDKLEKDINNHLNKYLENYDDYFVFSKSFFEKIIDTCLSLFKISLPIFLTSLAINNNSLIVDIKIIRTGFGLLVLFSSLLIIASFLDIKRLMCWKKELIDIKHRMFNLTAETTRIKIDSFKNKK